MLDSLPNDGGFAAVALVSGWLSHQLLKKRTNLAKRPAGGVGRGAAGAAVAGAAGGLIFLASQCAFIALLCAARLSSVQRLLFCFLVNVRLPNAIVDRYITACELMNLHHAFAAGHRISVNPFVYCGLTNTAPLCEITL